MKIFEKRQVKAAAKKLGFYAKGSFFIGVRNAEILSGVAIDSAPSSTYVWTFLLPAFDDNDFMHMTLGHRAINISSSDYPIEVALRNVWNPIADIRNAGQLLTYLDDRSLKSEYADWTRFLCHIRLGNFESASQMISTVENLVSLSIPRKISELKASLSCGGWPAVQEILVEWSSRTDELMSDVPRSMN